MTPLLSCTTSARYAEHGCQAAGLAAVGCQHTRQLHLSTQSPATAGAARPACGSCRQRPPPQRPPPPLHRPQPPRPLTWAPPAGAAGTVRCRADRRQADCIQCTDECKCEQTVALEWTCSCGTRRLRGFGDCRGHAAGWSCRRVQCQVLARRTQPRFASTLERCHSRRLIARPCVTSLDSRTATHPGGGEAGCAARRRRRRRLLGGGKGVGVAGCRRRRLPRAGGPGGRKAVGVARRRRGRLQRRLS